MNHTSVEVEERFLKLMLAWSPGERLTIACCMFSTAKALVRAGVLEEYGLKGPNQVREYMFLRLYGEDFRRNRKGKDPQFVEGDLTEQFTRRSLRARNSRLGCAYAPQGGTRNVEEED